MVEYSVIFLGQDLPITTKKLAKKDVWNDLEENEVEENFTRRPSKLVPTWFQISNSELDIWTIG